MTPSAAASWNPFPGLRPFREDEEHLFFGRESQVDTMIDKLARTRFLAVVGMSGSGKSSLVNSGLRPALHRGLMASGGTAWRMVQFRPGTNPVHAMARALVEQGVVRSEYVHDGVSLDDIVEASLRVSKTGLTDIYEAAEFARNVNLLLVVDQFEELFRYRPDAADASGSDEPRAQEAVAFVNLLLDARRSSRIYLVLTMRSDFLGDCAQFPGLPEAINEGQYLIPRLTREERRAAIAGPVRVGGGEISAVLQTRLVNDVGDNPDQLSVLQHALNRTWAAWWNTPNREKEMSMSDYEGIGTMARALDRHAEKAFNELTTPRQQTICERIFKALTDRGTDPRGIRRPTRFAALCALASASEQEAAEVIEVFRKPSRSFLMPPVPESLDADAMIDISHESLMRVWERLKTWTDEEAQCAQLYRRLSEAASLHAAGKTGLWSDPELQIAIDWRTKFDPTPEWAELYGGAFDRAMSFLAASEARRTKEQREQEESRERELTQAHALAEERRRAAYRFRIGFAIAAIFAVIATGFGLETALQHGAVEQERRVAEWRAVIAAATEVVRSDPELAALLIVNARALRPDAASNESLLGLEKSVLSRALTRMYGLSQTNGPEGSTYIAAFSPDGSLTATVDTTYVLHVWDTHTGRVIADRPQPQWIGDVAFSSDGATVMCVRQDGTVVPFDSRTGSPKDPTRVFQDTRSIRSLKLGDNGRSLTALGTDGRVAVWDVPTRVRKDLGLFGRHLDWAVLDDSGTQLIGAGHDGTLSIWQISPRRLILEVRSPAGPISAASYSPDRRMIVTTGVDKTARVFDAATGRSLLSLIGHKSALAGGSFLSDGRIATVGNDGVARTWSVSALTAPIRRLKTESNALLEVATFSDDGALVATATQESGRALVWDLGTGDVLPGGPGTELHTAINNFAFSADGKLLMTAGDDNLVDVRDVRTGHLTAVFTGPGQRINTVAFDLHAHRAVAAGPDGIVRVWDFDSRAFKDLPGHRGAVNAVDVSSGGIIVTAGDDGTTRLWSLADGHPLFELHGHPSEVIEATFSPDGRRIITAGADQTMRVWDAHSGKRLALARSYAGKVLSVRFSPDGKWFVSSHADGVVNVGDAGTGESVESLPGHTTWVNDAIFLSDSRTIRTISGDGTVRDIVCEMCVPEAELANIARERLANVKRDLSADERELYGLRADASSAAPTANRTSREGAPLARKHP